MADELPYYPLSAAQLAAINARSIAAGAGGYPASPGPVPAGENYDSTSLGQVAAGAGGYPTSPAPGGLSAVPVRAAAPVGGLGALNIDLGQYQRQVEIESQRRNAVRQAELGMIDQRMGQLGKGGISDLDRASMLFQAAGAFAAPTRTGNFMENLGAAGTAVSGPLAKAAEAQRDREDKMMQLQLARSKLAAEMGNGGLSAENMLKLYEIQQKQVQQPSEKERMYQMWQTEENPQRKSALGKMLGIDKDQQPSEKERMYQMWQTEENPQRKSALGKMLGIDKDQQPSEKERMYQMWQTEENPQRKSALGKMLSIDEDKEELKTLQLPDGTSMSVIMSGGDVLDPLTRRRLTPEFMSNRSTTSPEALQAESAVSGIPLPERDIFRNLPPKIRENAKAKTIETAKRVLDNLEKSAPESNLEKDITDTRRFLELNSKNESKTGPFVGMLPSVTEAAKDMDAIGAQMARKMREAGEGATSDYDAKMFQRMTLSTSNPYAVNRNIGIGVVAQRQSEIDRRDFMREYLSQNATLDGAQKYWKKYLNNNPVFNPRQKDANIRNIELNENRKDWRDYFREGGSQESSGSFVRGPDGKLILKGR